MAGAHMTGGAMDPLPTAAAEADCDEEADFPAPGTALGPPAPRRGAARPCPPSPLPAPVGWPVSLSRSSLGSAALRLRCPGSRQCGAAD